MTEHVQTEQVQTEHVQTQHVHTGIKTFIAVWAALLTLTALTVFASTVELGPFNAIVALTIATIKALLVLLFFMELRYSTALTKVAVVAAIFFFMLLAGLSLSDYLTRGWSSYVNPFR